jgi:spermidine synthase
VTARPAPRSPRAGVRAVATGTAELVPDGDGRGGWTVYVNGVPCSHVDPADPRRLEFEYMRWVADVLDTVAPDGEPLHTLHLGGAGCTLARYVAATRPASRQLVVELDPGLVDLVREEFGLRSTAAVRLRTGDAREVLTTLPDDRYAVIIRDAFEVDAVPARLRTRGFLSEVARVLAPGGVYLANMGDGGAMDGARAEAATALAIFAHVVVIAEPAQFNQRRFGNVLIAASDAPLPVAPLGRRLASGVVRARMLEDAEVPAFAAGRRPLEDPPSSPAAS